MDEPAAAPKPCCVCDEQGGKQCTKCKSRHYCSKKCQLVDWKEGGHKEKCKKLAAAFQDQLLDKLMPTKKGKEEPVIVDDVAPADGPTAAPRFSAAVFKARAPAPRAETTLVKASAPYGGAPGWRGTCAICLDLLPLEDAAQMFYLCCCKNLCAACSDKCRQHDARCPLCRAPISKSDAESLRRLQKHVDKGNAKAQSLLAQAYRYGDIGLKQSFERAFSLYSLAAAQGDVRAQVKLGLCHEHGEGVKIDFKAAAQWYRRAAEQGYPDAQYCLGVQFCHGRGVAQSYDEAMKWLRLAAAQGHANALFNLAACLANGDGVPQDLNEALRCYKRAAAKGNPRAPAKVEELEAYIAALAAHSRRPT